MRFEAGRFRHSDGDDADEVGIDRHTGRDCDSAFQYAAIARAKLLCMIPMVDPQMAERKKQRDAIFGMDLVLAIECPALDLMRPLSPPGHDVEINDGA